MMSNTTDGTCPIHETPYSEIWIAGQLRQRWCPACEGVKMAQASLRKAFHTPRKDADSKGMEAKL